MSEDAPQLLTSEDIFSAQFPATKFRDGYDQNQIDDYLDEVVRVLSYYEALNASPEAEVDLAYITVRGRDVREVDFDYTRMRVGYDQDAVDDYLDQVAATLEAYEKLYGIPPSDQRYQVLQVDGAALEAEAAEQAAASGELPSDGMPAGEETVTPIELSSEAPHEAPAVENAPDTADSAPSVPAATEPATDEDSGVRSSVLGTPTGSIPAVQPVSFEQAVFTDYGAGSPENGDFGGTGAVGSPNFPPLNSPVSAGPETPAQEAATSPVEGGAEQDFASEALTGPEAVAGPAIVSSAETAPADAIPEAGDEWGEVPQYPETAQQPADTDATAAQPYPETGYDPYQSYGYDAYGQPMTTNPADYQDNAGQYPGYPPQTEYGSSYGMATPEGYGYTPQAEGENQAYIPDDTTMVIPVTPAAPLGAPTPNETTSEYAQGYDQAGYPGGYEASPAETPPDYDSSFDDDQEKSYELEESLDDDYPEEITLDDSSPLPADLTDTQADSAALQADFYAPATPEETPASPAPAESAGYYSPESFPESTAQPYADLTPPPYAAPESPAATPLPYGMPEQPGAPAGSWQVPNPYQPEGLTPNEWGGTPQPSNFEQPAAPDFSTNEPVPVYPAPGTETPAEPATEQPEPFSEAPATPAQPAEPSLSTFPIPKLETAEMGQFETAPTPVNDLGATPPDYGMPGEPPKTPLTDVVAPPLPTPGVGMDLGQIREKLEHEQATPQAQPEPKLADVPEVLMTPTRSNATVPPTEIPAASAPNEPTPTETAPTETATERLSASRLEELAAQNAASVPEAAPDIPMVDTQSGDNESAKGQPAPIFPEDSNPRPMLQGEEPLAEVDPDGRFIPHFLAGYRSNLDTFTSVYGALDEGGPRAKPASIAKLEAQQRRKSITTGYLVTVATSRPLGADDQVFVRLSDGREVPVTSASSDFEGVHLTIPRI